MSEGAGFRADPCRLLLIKPIPASLLFYPPSTAAERPGRRLFLAVRTAARGSRHLFLAVRTFPRCFCLADAYFATYLRALLSVTRLAAKLDVANCVRTALTHRDDVVVLQALA
jgi:hypothetical protein